MTDEFEMKVGCGALVVFIMLTLILSIAANNHRRTYEFVVSSKERQCDGGRDGTCYYVVFGTDGEVFANKDSLWNGKFNSASVQGRFVPGHRYRVETIGWRVPILSMMPNIVKVAEVPAHD